MGVVGRVGKERYIVTNTLAHTFLTSCARSLMSMGYSPVKHEVQNCDSVSPVARIMPSYERKRREVAPRYSRISSTDFVEAISFSCLGVLMPSKAGDFTG